MNIYEYIISQMHQIVVTFRRQFSYNVLPQNMVRSFIIQTIFHARVMLYIYNRLYIQTTVATQKALQMFLYYRGGLEH